MLRPDHRELPEEDPVVLPEEEQRRHVEAEEQVHHPLKDVEREDQAAPAAAGAAAGELILQVVLGDPCRLGGLGGHLACEQGDSEGGQLRSSSHRGSPKE